MKSTRSLTPKLLLLFFRLFVLVAGVLFIGYSINLITIDQDIPVITTARQSLATLASTFTKTDSAISSTDQNDNRTPHQNAWRRVLIFLNLRSNPPTLEEVIAEAPAGIFKPLTDAINQISDQLPCDTESDCLSYCLDPENAQQCDKLIENSGYTLN